MKLWLGRKVWVRMPRGEWHGATVGAVFPDGSVGAWIDSGRYMGDRVAIHPGVFRRDLRVTKPEGAKG